jgi:hypothetical protein
VELIQLEQLCLNTGGTFNVTGFSTGTTLFVTGGTYTAGTAVFRTILVVFLFENVTGFTVEQ